MTPDDPVTRGEPMLPGRPDALFAGPADDPDRYELTGDGITGGEGTTWRARYAGHLTAPLPLAVKLLHPPPSAGPGWPTADDRRRWLDQAVLLRYMRLDHVVHVQEVFFGALPHARRTGAAPESAAYVVMEWLEGPTLHQAVGDSAVTLGNLDQRLGYLEDAASALAALASTSRSAGNPSLHRDVKPTNCIVTADRGLVLIDVSTVRLLADGFDPAGRHTPGYTAPEVLSAPHRARTPASDMYALGALALFCLTGREPATVLDMHDAARVRGELSSVLRDAGLSEPDVLATQVLAALDPDPARRPHDPVGWSRRARIVAARRSRVARRLGWVAAVAVLVVVAGVTLAAHPWRTVPTTPADRATGVAAAPSIADTNAGPVAASTGEITSPPDGSKVPQCAYFAGTSRLPSGWTLILAMRNTSNNDPHQYDQYVFDWKKPELLSRWQGYQFFGQVDSDAGQVYEVQLIAVTLDDAQHNVNTTDYGDALNRSGKVLDTVRLTRVPGLGPHNCDGRP